MTQEPLNFSLNFYGIKPNYQTWWEAVADCFKYKLWGHVRVVLRDDGLYHIEMK